MSAALTDRQRQIADARAAAIARRKAEGLLLPSEAGRILAPKENYSNPARVMHDLERRGLIESVLVADPRAEGDTRARSRKRYRAADVAALQRKIDRIRVTDADGRTVYLRDEEA